MTALIRFTLGFMLVLSSLFLIALVLIQRGRGGGLAGALGGMGGQSAFGTKAGDVFTRITVVVAACWILLCILAINVLGRQQSMFSPALGGSAGQAVPAQTTTPPAGGPPATPPAAPAGDSKTEATPPAAETTQPAADSAATQPAADAKGSEPATPSEPAKAADAPAAEPAK